ncbi:MAG: glycine--tRNA ligase subunit beta [Rhodospirillaceae bacterium]|jgi:glycyl-tRNA synthetase beta chain|nr:glycine--tRNA ligase subunit beta [Rhodospirillaceae bacterium]
MAELLLELFSEEIPARMQRRAADDLARLVTGQLEKAGLDFDEARSYATPRRLVLVVEGLPETQPDVREERKGPKVGSPDKAIEGFLKSVGLESLDQCETREIKGNEFHFAVVERKGRTTPDVLAEFLPGLLTALPWAKSMRWGEGDIRWVRPLQSILCLFNGKAVAFTFGHVSSGKKTQGHRFMAPDPISVTDFADYRTKLEAAKVLLDPAARQALIEQQSKALAGAKGLEIWPDSALTEEVAGLVEWPVVLIGSIDAEYMDLPPEVLATSMRKHQKYFSLLDGQDNLAPYFLVVANIEADDDGAAILAGNERVLRARLADARFFWDTDCKQTLASRVQSLNGITFHAKLGSLGQKVERLQVLAADLAAQIPEGDVEKATRAAFLCKADLVTGMVGEFPDLQGVMGRYYAFHDGEVAMVGEAIGNHYAPAGPKDDCPDKPTAIAVALADKIDTLTGFFAIDETPTGSKDPFALRRAALGVIRLVLDNKLRLELLPVFDAARRLYEKGGLAQARDFDPATLLDFFADRLKVHLREEGVRHDHIAAIFALGGESDLVRLLARVASLGEFLNSENGANLLTVYQRAGNIVAIEEKKDGVTYDGEVDASLLAEKEEKTLSETLTSVEAISLEKIRVEDFAAAMTAMASLRVPGDDFFDKVMVNCEDKAMRVNRLRLLSRIRATMNKVADFSQIEGS